MTATARQYAASLPLRAVVKREREPNSPGYFVETLECGHTNRPRAEWDPGRVTRVVKRRCAECGPQSRGEDNDLQAG